jgi:SnoaL-like domain
MAFSREEIQEAFDRYCAAAEEAGRTGDWGPWVACFTEDVRYIEHLYGEFRGREAIQAWIEQTMNEWPFTWMQVFPWDWYTIDAEQGWVVGQVENRFLDPGDGQVHEGANWTRLVYAGDGLFSSEEDVYNPSRFAPAVEGWLAAWKVHHPDAPGGLPRP